MQPHYRVLVGNIGKVYDGTDEHVARHWFNQYIAESKTNKGRAGGESVFLIVRIPRRNHWDEDLIDEYQGANDRD